MRIQQASVSHYRIPRTVWWPLPLADKTLTIDTIEIITCEITTTDGATGLGYTYTLGRGGSAVYSLLASDIIAALAGTKIESPKRLWKNLWSDLLRVGRAGVVPVALAALDLALWDALAVEAGVALHVYLGNVRGSVPAYGSAIDLGYSTDELVESVGSYRDRGFRAVKVKVGRSAAEDLQRLAAVRMAIGDEIELMVDANLGWTLPEAARRVSRLEHFDLAWLEEPLQPDDVFGHARLQRATSIPIAVGETLFTIGEFERYVNSDAARILQPDVGRLGGITPWLEVASLAEAVRLPLAPHFMQDVHVHLLCAHSAGGTLEYLPLLDKLIEEPLTVVKGEAHAPTKPGIGVRFQREVIDPYCVATS